MYLFYILYWLNYPAKSDFEDDESMHSDTPPVLVSENMFFTYRTNSSIAPENSIREQAKFDDVQEKSISKLKSECTDSRIVILTNGYERFGSMKPKINERHGSIKPKSDDRECSTKPTSDHRESTKPKSNDRGSGIKPKSDQRESSTMPNSNEHGGGIKPKSDHCESSTKPKSNEHGSGIKPKSDQRESSSKPKSNEHGGVIKPKSDQRESSTKPKSNEHGGGIKPKSDHLESSTKPKSSEHGGGTKSKSDHLESSTKPKSSEHRGGTKPTSDDRESSTKPISDDREKNTKFKRDECQYIIKPTSDHRESTKPKRDACQGSSKPRSDQRDSNTMHKSNEHGGGIKPKSDQRKSSTKLKSNEHGGGIKSKSDQREKSTTPKSSEHGYSIKPKSDQRESSTKFKSNDHGCGIKPKSDQRESSTKLKSNEHGGGIKPKSDQCESSTKFKSNDHVCGIKSKSDQYESSTTPKSSEHRRGIKPKSDQRKSSTKPKSNDHGGGIKPKMDQRESSTKLKSNENGSGIKPKSDQREISTTPKSSEHGCGIKPKSSEHGGGIKPKSDQRESSTKLKSNEHVGGIIAKRDHCENSTEPKNDECQSGSKPKSDQRESSTMPKTNELRGGIMPKSDQHENRIQPRSDECQGSIMPTRDLREISTNPKGEDCQGDTKPKSDKRNSTSQPTSGQHHSSIRPTSTVHSSTKHTSGGHHSTTTTNKRAEHHCATKNPGDEHNSSIGNKIDEHHSSNRLTSTKQISSLNMVSTKRKMSLENPQNSRPSQSEEYLKQVVSGENLSSSQSKHSVFQFPTERMYNAKSKSEHRVQKEKSLLSSEYHCKISIMDNVHKMDRRPVEQVVNNSGARSEQILDKNLDKPSDSENVSSDSSQNLVQFGLNVVDTRGSVTPSAENCVVTNDCNTVPLEKFSISLEIPLERAMSPYCASVQNMSSIDPLIDALETTYNPSIEDVQDTKDSLLKRSYESSVDSVVNSRLLDSDPGYSCIKPCPSSEMADEQSWMPLVIKEERCTEDLDNIIGLPDIVNQSIMSSDNNTGTMHIIGSLEPTIKCSIETSQLGQDVDIKKQKSAFLGVSSENMTIFVQKSVNKLATILKLPLPKYNERKKEVLIDNLAQSSMDLKMRSSNSADQLPVSTMCEARSTSVRNVSTNVRAADNLDCVDEAWLPTLEPILAAAPCHNAYLDLDENDNEIETKVICNNKMMDLQEAMVTKDTEPRPSIRVVQTHDANELTSVMRDVTNPPIDSIVVKIENIDVDESTTCTPADKSTYLSGVENDIPVTPLHYDPLCAVSEAIHLTSDISEDESMYHSWLENVDDITMTPHNSAQTCTASGESQLSEENVNVSSRHDVEDDQTSFGITKIVEDSNFLSVNKSIRLNEYKNQPKMTTEVVLEEQARVTNGVQPCKDLSECSIPLSEMPAELLAMKDDYAEVGIDIFKLVRFGNFSVLFANICDYFFVFSFSPVILLFVIALFNYLCTKFHYDSFKI